MDTTKTLTLLDIFREVFPGKGEQTIQLLDGFVKERVEEARLRETARTNDRIGQQVEKEVAKEAAHLATKGDLHAVEKGIRSDMHAMEKGIRSDMHAMENRLVYWIIGGVITILLAIATLAYSTNQGNKASAQQQAPAFSESR